MDSLTRRLQALDRQRSALELRKAGATFQMIAEKLGYRSPSGAQKAFKAAMKATLREPAEELRILEAERLDAAQLALWKRCLAGDVKAIGCLLGIMKRRGELFGLQAPKRTDGEIVITDEMLMREIERAKAEIARRGGQPQREDLSCLSDEELAFLKKIQHKLDDDHEKQRGHRR